MKKSEAKPGEKVIASLVWPDNMGYEPAYVSNYQPNKYNENVLTGVILDKKASEDDHVVVAWDDNCDADEEEQEVEIKVLALQSQKSELEKDFDVASEAIHAKMKEAAKLIKEANKMAVKAGAPHLESMYEVTSPLVSAMDNSGWRSSSWGC